ncbi:MAG TPA: flagellar biosynthetic protein FliO [Gammaproteobacteria bacterium]
MSVRRSFRAAAAGAALAVSQALAAAEGGGPVAPSAASLVQLVLGLLAVVAALLLFGRWLPRLGGFGPAAHPRFKILASLPIGHRERIVLMQAGERQIVVGVAPGRINALHVLEEPLEIETGAPRGRLGEPSAWLARALGGRRP